MKQTFLSIGECMVEMAPTASGDYHLGFAGDTLNTAWYARQTLAPHWDVAYFTAVGQDAISLRMTDFIGNARYPHRSDTPSARQDRRPLPDPARQR